VTEDTLPLDPKWLDETKKLEEKKDFYPDNIHIVIKEITLKRPMGTLGINVKYDITTPRKDSEDKIVDFRHSASKYMIIEQNESLIMAKRLVDYTDISSEDLLKLFEQLTDLVKKYLENIYGKETE
jgi:hypothetical protein